MVFESFISFSVTVCSLQLKGAEAEASGISRFRSRIDQSHLLRYSLQQHMLMLSL